jgi:hypothetical protein
MVENNRGVRFGYALKTRTIRTRLVSALPVSALLVSVHQRLAVVTCCNVTLCKQDIDYATDRPYSRLCDKLYNNIGRFIWYRNH